MRNNHYQTYTQNNINIESPEKLITMLYEGILRFIFRAKKCIDEGDIEGRVYFINKTNAIFFELINSLDMNQGGISYYLSGLYARQIELLIQANLHAEKKYLDEVVNVTRELLEAWKDSTKEVVDAMA